MADLIDAAARPVIGSGVRWTRLDSARGGPGHKSPWPAARGYHNPAGKCEVPLICKKGPPGMGARAGRVWSARDQPSKGQRAVDGLVAAASTLLVPKGGSGVRPSQER